MERVQWASVTNVAVLVVDRNNPRFGELGKLLAHDWREYGIYEVEFPGGAIENFHDCWTVQLN